MRKLGLVGNLDEITPQLQQDYLHLFDQPLSEQHVRAIRDLFSIQELPVAADLQADDPPN